MTGALRAWLVVTLLGLTSTSGCAHAGSSSPRQPALQPTLSTIIERLELAKADISAAAVTADCEQGRADILRDSLTDRETARTRALTIASLGVGALTSVAAGASRRRDPRAPHRALLR